MKSIILFSGGIDSLLTWHIAKQFSNPIALLLDRGQSEEELGSAHDLIQHYDIDYRFDSIPFLSQPNNKHETNYIPCRNAMMLTLAASYAIQEQSTLISIGVNKEDYDNYVDCRIQFIRDFEKMIYHYDDQIRIDTPLINLTKVEIIKRCIKDNLALELTHTCYTPIEGLSCGTCNACILRLKAFAELGLNDPIKYV